MAETGKKATDRVAVSPVNDPAPEPAEESPRASVRVRTEWPHSSFTVQGVPEITADGTMLTKTQLTEVEKLAPEYGVGIQVEEVK